MGKRASTLERYLGRGEQIVVETRQHPFAIVAGFIEAIAWLIPLSMVLWGMYGQTWLSNKIQDGIFYGIFSAMILVLVRLAWSVLGWELAKVVVTSEKVIHIHGVLNRKISSTPLVKVSELTVSQPLLGRVFGYGALMVDAPGGGRPLHGLGYIPDPAVLYRTINEISRRERAYEGGADLSENPYDPDLLDPANDWLASQPDSSVQTGGYTAEDAGGYTGPITMHDNPPGPNDVTNVIRPKFPKHDPPPDESLDDDQ